MVDQKYPMGSLRVFSGIPRGTPGGIIIYFAHYILNAIIQRLYKNKFWSLKGWKLGDML